MYRELIYGLNTSVPILNGEMVQYINFDNAATTPPFTSVIDEIINFAKMYSSVHRGTGYKSVYSSYIYEEARKIILDFVNGSFDNHEVIFVKNTTEGINKLSYRLKDEIKDGIVLSTTMEHHSNDLPWRKYKMEYVNVDSSGRLSIEDLEYKLKKHNGHIKLVTVAGASNVTGYINPIYEIAKLTHKYGGKLLVDGAQLIPHSPVNMKHYNSSEHIDYLVFSAHKMYAPFGIGVLIGPKEVFQRGAPEYVGGGTVKLVTHDTIIWDDPPYKDEAGTPNLFGVVALIYSIITLQSLGMENIDFYEKKLTYYGLDELKKLPNIIIYCDNDINNKVSIIPFNIEGIHHEMLAYILAKERGIGIRSGCFCAQPYVQKLLKIPPNDMEKYKNNLKLPRPGMVRISFGLYNNYDELNILLELLKDIASNREKYLNKYRNTPFS